MLANAQAPVRRRGRTTRDGLAVTIYDGHSETDVVVSEPSDGAMVRRNIGRYRSGFERSRAVWAQ